MADIPQSAVTQERVRHRFTELNGHISTLSFFDIIIHLGGRPAFQMTMLRSRQRFIVQSLLRPPSSPLTHSPLISKYRLVASLRDHHTFLHPATRPSFATLRLAARLSPSTRRALTTEQTSTITYGLKLGIYWSAILWIVLFSGSVCWWVLNEDLLDRTYPSPPEWRFLTKSYWRSAKDELETEGHGRGILDWTKIGTHSRIVVGLLEDYKFIVHRPSGCILQSEVWDQSLPFASDEELHASVPPPPRGGEMWPSRIGYDISMQSEAWRRGYWDAMMGLAKAAEMRDGYMTHEKDRIAYAPQHIRSESNPYPVPLPPGADKECPDAEDCYPTLESADFHYKRLLTTKGFESRQRIEAGIAYASWLDHKEEHQAANDMYRWSLQLAMRGLPETISPQDVVDDKTGVLRPNAPIVTSNLLAATSALARHYTQTDRVADSLAIYLSTLRARRQSPDAPQLRQYPPREPDWSLRTVESVIRWITNFPFDPEYPPPPPSGDEMFERKKSDECEEAALSLYVSEILFATMGRRREGLAWTRDATDAAERRQNDKFLNAKGRKICEQCVHTGLQNWVNMVAVLAKEQAEKEGKHPVSKGDEAGQSSNVSWFWKGLDTIRFRSEPDADLIHEQDWESERKQLQYRLADFEEALLNRKLNAMIQGNSNWFVV